MWGGNGFDLGLAIKGGGENEGGFLVFGQQENGSRKGKKMRVFSLLGFLGELNVDHALQGWCSCLSIFPSN